MISSNSLPFQFVNDCDSHLANAIQTATKKTTPGPKSKMLLTDKLYCKL